MATGHEIRAIRLTGGEWVEGVGPRGGRTTMPSPRISVKCYLWFTVSFCLNTYHGIIFPASLGFLYYVCSWVYEFETFLCQFPLSISFPSNMFS